MPIECLTPKEWIDRYMDEKISEYEESVIRKLEYAGELCITQARDHGSYKDHTGNLRSSVGYVIVKNGSIVSRSSFGNNSEGATAGQEFAERIASKFRKGIALVVVAGMEYASYVEANGYDVLTSSEILAERLMAKMFKKK